MGSMSFPRDKAASAVRLILDGLLGSQETYHGDKMQELAREIPEKCTRELEKLSKEFKFIVNCAIVPKGKCFGFHSSNACVWDSESDGSVCVQWENSSYYCNVNVYGISF